MLRCLMLLTAALPMAARAETLSRMVDGASLRVGPLCAASVAIRPDPAARQIAVTATGAQAELDPLRIAGGRVASVTRAGACPAGPPTLTVEIAIPPRLAVSVQGSGATEYRIGAVGALSGRFAGSSKVAVESAADLTIGLSGSVRATVEHAAGAALLSVSGSGDVTVQQAAFQQTAIRLSGSGSVAIKSGSVGALRIDAAGSGRVRIDGEASEATLNASGSSLVYLAHNVGRLLQRPSGGSAITVGP